MNQHQDRAISVYGKATCGDTMRSRALLDARGVTYAYLDVEVEPAQAQVAKLMSGDSRVPVVVVGDQHVLVEPTDEELGRALDDLDSSLEG